MTGFDCRDKTGVYGQSLTNQGDLAATLEITSVSDKILEFFSGFMEFLSSKFCLAVFIISERSVFRQQLR